MTALAQEVRRRLGVALGSDAYADVIADILEVSNVLSSTEAGYLDSVTAGTGAASKAVVLDSNGKVVLPGELDASGNTSGAAGVGITAGTNTVFKNNVMKVGGIITTNILIDLTGLASSTTDLDIIGVAGGPAHIGQMVAALNGTILGGRMTCLELPAGGADDIDLYYATEGTGAFDAGIGTLTSTALITSGAAWALNTQKSIADPAALAGKYLYLTGGEAGTAATYTAGKFLIELWGYDA